MTIERGMPLPQLGPPPQRKLTYTITEYANGDGEHLFTVSDPYLRDAWGQPVADFKSFNDAVNACNRDADQIRNKVFKEVRREVITL